MLHRVILGAVERFLGVLIEHYAGAFPVWLAPVQAVVMNITDAQLEYARTVAARLREADVRCDLDVRNEKIGFKIRESRLQKVPYMVIVGDRERDEGTISVRDRDGEQHSMRPEDLAEMIRKSQPML